MKIKKILCIVTLVAVLVASVGITGNAEEITVQLDGKKVECTVPARIENGRTMVPMRAIFEAFGMTVEWNNEERSVTATKGDDVIKLVIGEKEIVCNGEGTALDVAPYIAEDTTLVPVRAVSESLDAKVEWNDKKRRVEITTAEYEANKDKWKENTGKIDLTAMNTDADGVEIKENTVLITKGGDFSVFGENLNAMIHVDTNERVKLRLEGINLKNETGPAIFFENSDKSFITVSKGTENFVSDGEEYSVEAKATIFSNDDIEIKGEGTLEVKSVAHHALASDDDIKIEEGVLILSSDAKDGIHANNEIKIQGGEITVTAKGDGIQAEENIVVEGGIINVTTTGTVAPSMGGFGGGGMPQGGFGNRGGRGNRDWNNAAEGGMAPPEGMEGMVRPEGMTPPEGMEGMVRPEGMMPPEGTEGMVRPEGMNPFEETVAAEDEATATKGIKATVDITISGGSITVSSADHAVHSAGTLNIKEGTMELTSQAGKGISAHGDVVIDGGKINILKASEGLESKANLTINGGEIQINGSDDGINAGGTGGRDVANRQNSEQSTGHDLIINGGTIFVNASGDGLDANGRMIINGGDIIVEGPTNNGNGSLDSGGVIQVNGGTLIALGASGMAETPDNNSKQPSFRLVTESNIAQNSKITITNSKGEKIYAYTTVKTGNSVIFSSDKLVIGEEYTVRIGETAHSVKLENNVTSVGNGGFGGGFGGGRRW